MRVSVIIPNYNHARFLHQRIESVLGQTYSDYEVLILDDCSYDDSRSIMEQYRNHPKVSQLVYNEHNSGSPFKQWQKGIELAKGDWIWMAESDDYCAPGFLKALLNNAQRCDTTVLSYCQSYEVDERGQVLGDISWHVADLHATRWKEDFCNDGRDEISTYLLYRNTIPNASAVIFRKSAFEKVSRKFSHLRLCGDWLLWVELLKLGNIAFKAEAYNFFRTHGATTRVLNSSDKIKMRQSEEYEVVSEIKNITSAQYQVRAQRRLSALAYAYGASFTKEEIYGYLRRPSLYRGIIPLRKVIWGYVKNKIL